MKKTLPLGALLLSLTLLGATAARGEGPHAALYDALSLFTEALGIVANQYVEPRPMDRLVDDAIVGLLQKVDPDGGRLDANTARNLDRASREHTGVGLLLTRRGAAPGLVVVAPAGGGPAQHAGIHPGDRLVKIDGRDTGDLQLWQAIESLRGAPGSQVTLTVARAGWADPRDIVLTREAPSGSPVVAHALAGGVIDIEVREVGDGTAREIQTVLDGHPGGRPAGVVLDLRNDARGTLAGALAVSRMFLEAGQAVGVIRHHAPARSEELQVAEPGPYRGMPLVVLVNEGTAGVAETVAGALQDWGRAVVVGARTFGLGASETLIPLSDGSVIRLATGRAFTPRGRPIDGAGIAPDVAVANTAVTDDLQLRRAVEALTVERFVQHAR